MDKIELIGFLLQELRDSRDDEEDLDPTILRETTPVYDLIIQHGYLTRGMFDLAEVDVEPAPPRYAQYRTTNYPVAFVAFADRFARWLH